MDIPWASATEVIYSHRVLLVKTLNTGRPDDEINIMQEILSRIQRLDQLIRIKGTGSPTELAQRIGISERSVYEYLKLMKGLGAPIKYSREKKSYSYTYEGNFRIEFVSN